MNENTVLVVAIPTVSICTAVYYGWKRWLEHKEIMAGNRDAKDESIGEARILSELKK